MRKQLRHLLRYVKDIANEHITTANGPHRQSTDPIDKNPS